MKNNLITRLNQRRNEDPTSWKNQKDLAARLGTNQATISRLLQGKIRRLPDRTITALSKFLSIDSNQIRAELDDSQSNGLNESSIRDNMSAIADDLPYQIYIKNVEREFVWANRAMLLACNCSSLGELKGLKDEDLFTNPHRDEAKSDDEEVLLGKSIIDKVEFETWRQTWKPSLRPELDDPDSSRSAPKRQRLRLVVTTKKPFKQSGRIVGIIGFTQPFEIALPDFLRETGNPWNFGSFTGGIYYKNFRTNHMWCDEIFRDNFPSETFHQRWIQVWRADRPRIANFFRHLINLESPTPKPAIIDFRAEVKHTLQWFRATGIALGGRNERAIICGHQAISEEMASESLAERCLLTMPKNAFVFIEDERRKYCFMNRSFLETIEMKLPDIIGKTFEDLGIRNVISSSTIKSKSIMGRRTVLLPVVDYEQIQTRNGRELKLMTIRIPISSNLFPVWGGGYYLKNQQRHHTLGIAWDMSHDENLFFEELSTSVWANLLTTSGDAVYIKEASSGRYLSVNKEFANRVGMRKADVLNKTANDIEAFKQEPDLLKAIRNEDESLVRCGGRTQAIRRRTHPDGKKWSELSIKNAINSYSGKVEYILGISRKFPDDTDFFLRE